MKTFLFYFILSVFSFPLPLHPIHVSVASIEENFDEKIYEITFKIFIDDFERSIEQAYKTKVKFDVGGKIIPENGSELILKYFQDNFKLKVNEKKINLQYMGIETNLESIWVFFQAGSIDSPAKIQAQNTVLFNVHDDQSNILHLTFKRGKTSLLFNHSEPEHVFSFE